MCGYAESGEVGRGTQIAIDPHTAVVTFEDSIGQGEV